MVVLFVDMDSFYASCELLRRPELGGKAFIVGTYDEAHKTRGVVETASYAAKKLGIHSAMPTVMAMKIKPDIVYVPSDHDYYDSMSAKVMELLKSFGFRTEVLSVDEAALDLENVDYAKAEKLGKDVKAKVLKDLGLPCTVGIGPGKIFAKMVCDAAKPDGLKVVTDKEVIAFLDSKDVQKIPGVGYKTAERLKAAGITKINELAKADPAKMKAVVGSFGAELIELANGIDNSKIVDVWVQLSIGRERSFERRTNRIEDILPMLDMLADEVIAEVKRQKFKFKTITAVAKYADHTDRIKSRSLSRHSDSVELLKETEHELIKELIGDKLLRKVGVRVSGFGEDVEEKQKKLL